MRFGSSYTLWSVLKSPNKNLKQRLGRCAAKCRKIQKRTCLSSGCWVSMATQEENPAPLAGRPCSPKQLRGWGFYLHGLEGSAGGSRPCPGEQRRSPRPAPSRGTGRRPWWRPPFQPDATALSWRANEKMLMKKWAFLYILNSRRFSDWLKDKRPWSLRR